MTEEMVEKVARAIYAARGLEEMVSWERAIEVREGYEMQGTYSRNQLECFELARAAIAAIQDTSGGEVEPDVRRRLLSVATTLETCGKHGVPIDFALLAHDIRAALSQEKR